MNSYSKKIKIPLFPILIGFVLIIVIISIIIGNSKNNSNLVTDKSTKYDLIGKNISSNEIYTMEMLIGIKQQTTYFDLYYTITISSSSGSNFDDNKIKELQENLKLYISSSFGNNEPNFKIKNGKIIVNFSNSNYNYSDIASLKNDLIEAGFKF